jgi:hypothetical protein
MKEDFLQYVWQYQYFDQAELQTAEGERVLVIRPGHRNADAGPDFLGAQLLLNEVKWAGSVEIHLRASDWLRHQHQHDPKYDQVILHVVWENDSPITRTDGSPIPTLALRGRVAVDLLSSYQNLLHSPASLPCAPFIKAVPDLTRKSMQDRALMERLEEKADLVLQQYRSTGQDWEATAYQVLAAAFGFKINQEPFARLSRALPLAVLKRHRQALFQLEALLLGQAGLLPGEKEGDDYTQRLGKEYAYLAHKYELAPNALRASDWNFLRLRPSNFPTVRLAQLAALLATREHLFSSLLRGHGYGHRQHPYPSGQHGGAAAGSLQSANGGAGLARQGPGTAGGVAGGAQPRHPGVRRAPARKQNRRRLSGVSGPEPPLLSPPPVPGLRGRKQNPQT